MAALLGCLALVGLPDAELYSRGGWAPIPAAGSLVLVVVGWMTAGRKGAVTSQPGDTSDPAGTPNSGATLLVPSVELLVLAAAGAFLTALFWVRAHLGVPSIFLGNQVPRSRDVLPTVRTSNERWCVETVGPHLEGVPRLGIRRAGSPFRGVP